MEGSDKGFSSSTPLKPCGTPKPSSSSDAAGSDENEQSHQQVGAKLQNTKTSVKNFMSPTTSAASKAVAPRKRILVERNEAPGSIPTKTHPRKTPNLDSKTHSANLGIDSSDRSLYQVTPFNGLLSKASQSKDEELNTSKAVVPRKKILSESNEVPGSIPTETHLRKTPNLDLKTHSANLGIDSSDRSWYQVTPLNELLFKTSQPKDDELNTFNSNLSSQPYDPLTNYLSPRPKYLRYKPHRRREFILCQERKLREGKDGLGINRSVSFDSKKVIVDDEMTRASGSSDSSSQEGFLKQESKEMVQGQDDDGGEEEEDENEEEEEDENEELEEQGTRIWKGVLKSLLVIFVLILSSSYISFMNSPTHSPASQAIESLKDGYKKIQNHIIGHASMKRLEEGNEFVDQREEIETVGFRELHQREEIETVVGFRELNQRDTDEGFEEASADYKNTGIVEDSEEFGEVVEPREEKEMVGFRVLHQRDADEGFGEASVDDENTGIVEDSEEFGEVVEQREEIEMVGFRELHLRDADEGFGEASVDDENTGMVEDSEEFGEVVEQQDGATEGVSGHKMDGTEEEGIEKFGEVVKQQDGAPEGVSDHKMEGTEEVSDKMARSIELEGIETASYSDSEEFGEVGMGEVSVSRSLELEGIQTALYSEILQAHQGNNFDWVDHHDTVLDDEFMTSGTTSRDDNDQDEDHMGQVGAISCDEVSGKGEFGINEMEMAEDTIAHSFGDNAVMDEENTGIGVSDLDKEGNMKVAIEHFGIESISKTVIGVVSTMFVIVSTVLVLYFRGRIISSKDSSSNANLTSNVNPSSEPVIAAKGSSELLIEREKQIENVDSFVNPTSSIHSFGESSKAFQQSRAPTVKLLGEFFVGDTSSSRKSHSEKSKMLEEEESNFCVSPGESLRSKIHTVPVHAQESPSEFSSIDSASYGSFRGQKVILKIVEGGKDGETTKVVRTPVRRSSRLRSRAFSP